MSYMQPTSHESTTQVSEKTNSINTVENTQPSLSTKQNDNKMNDCAEKGSLGNSDLSMVKIASNTIALVRAADDGQLEVLKELLGRAKLNSRGNEKFVNSKYENGVTALMCASGRGHVESLKFLLQQEGIDLNQTDDGEMTALMWAADNGRSDCVALLLENKNVNEFCRGVNGTTALICAVTKGHYFCVIPILKRYAEGRRSPIEHDAKGKTPVMHAAACGHFEILKLLLNAPFSTGINILSLDHTGNNAVMLAASRGHADCLKVLIDYGLREIEFQRFSESLLISNRIGLCALKMAVQGLYVNCVKSLLDVNENNINTTDQSGLTSLRWAIKRNNAELLNLLLQYKGINLDAVSDEHSAIVEAACKGREECLRILLEHRRFDDSKINLAFLGAAENGRASCVSLLLRSHLIDINVWSKGRIPRTALMLAAQSNSTDTVEVLLNSGADAGLQSLDGKTAAQCTSDLALRGVLLESVEPSAGYILK